MCCERPRRDAVEVLKRIHVTRPGLNGDMDRHRWFGGGARALSGAVEGAAAEDLVPGAGVRVTRPGLNGGMDSQQLFQDDVDGEMPPAVVRSAVVSAGLSPEEGVVPGGSGDGVGAAAEARRVVEGPSRADETGDELELASRFRQAGLRAEAAQLGCLLQFVDRREAEAQAAQENLVERSVSRKAAMRQAAQVLGMTDRSAAGTLNAAGFARDHLPRLWSAFRAGEVDFARVRRVAQTAARLEDQSLVARLDAEVLVHAQVKTLGEMGSWLSRRIATLDTEAHTKLCQRAQADRWVRVEHHEDGTSMLEARIPTLAAAAIEKRLAAAARGLDTPAGTGGPADCSSLAESPDADAVNGVREDVRTLAQREADLFCAWLQDGRIYQAPTAATVCVMIPEATLAGISEEPGLAADRSWTIPAAQARALAGNGAKHRWYTAVTVPKASSPTGAADDTQELAEHDADLLSVIHHGYTPPARVRDAVILRDGVCAADGCVVPAERCDIDHRVPFDQGGPTAGTNLQALCRSHHRMKSHGHPVTTKPAPGTQPSGPEPAPAIVPDLYDPPEAQSVRNGSRRFDHPQTRRTPSGEQELDEERRLLVA